MVKSKTKRSSIGESGLKLLKKDYERIRTRYKLPSFQQLNEEFEIERIAEKETDMLLREVRKAITEKVVAFLRFLELMINPSGAPFFLLAILKNLSSVDKKLIEKIYKMMGEFEIKAISLDLKYSEKAEAEFIRESAKKWQEMQPELEELSEVLKRAWNASTEKKERSYFG
jgi:hypothetical protein